LFFSCVCWLLLSFIVGSVVSTSKQDSRDSLLYGIYYRASGDEYGNYETYYESIDTTTGDVQTLSKLPDVLESHPTTATYDSSNHVFYWPYPHYNRGNGMVLYSVSAGDGLSTNELEDYIWCLDWFPPRKGKTTFPPKKGKTTGRRNSQPGTLYAATDSHILLIDPVANTTEQKARFTPGFDRWSSATDKETGILYYLARDLQHGSTGDSFLEIVDTKTFQIKRVVLIQCFNPLAIFSDYLEKTIYSLTYDRVQDTFKLQTVEIGTGKCSTPVVELNATSKQFLGGDFDSERKELSLFTWNRDSRNTNTFFVVSHITSTKPDVKQLKFNPLRKATSFAAVRYGKQ